MSQQEMSQQQSGPLEAIQIVVRPVRFTATSRQCAGSSRCSACARIESERGGWVDMVAGAGMVALHSAADSDTGGEPGETRLSFEADDLAALSARLKAGGTKLVVVHDESYGQVLSCQDPIGDTVWVDGRSEDLYGYRLHQATPDERCKVMPVRFTEPQGSYAGFLEALGLARLGAPDDFYAILSGPGDCGQVGLHRVYSDELPILPGPAAVHLTFLRRPSHWTT